MRSVLVVSKEKDLIGRVRSAFDSRYRVDPAAGRPDGLIMLQKSHYDIAFVDLEILLQSEPHDIINAFKQVRPSLEIVVITPRDRIREAVKAVKAGASNYLTYPIEPDEVKLVTETIYDTAIQISELNYLRDQFWRTDAWEIVQTKSDVMASVFGKIKAVAPTKTAVLLIGETGTGKSLLAKLIHKHSNRREAQFIEVHCGAIPDTLLESELFGHEKGAFTGAVRKRLGKFEIAKGGTLFLDEIGTITPSAQIKLLQVLQDGTFSHVGGEVMLQSDARVIAATNADLKEMTDAGQFRKDLFYRLNVFPIEIPPLRERKEDIPFLMDVFLKKLNKELGKNIHTVRPNVYEAFKSYPWPGNIRELENVIERAYILETSAALSQQSFPRELFGGEATMVPIPVDTAANLADARKKAIEDFERQYLKDLLVRNKGKMNKSAQEADISTRQLHKLLIKYKIRKEDFKAHP